MIEIERGSGNVYADLNLPGAEEMRIKAQLAMMIGDLLHARGWSQKQAARVLGMTQPRLSNLLNGQFRGISEAKMLECLTRLGHDVRIVVGPAHEQAGHVDVMFA